MLASHVLGASWYLLSIERYATCWKSQCRKEVDPIKCFLSYLDCGSLNNDGRLQWINSTHVFSNCNPENSIGFNYGIFENALTNNVVSSSFLEKYMHCLWWGLQNLSSYGQTLTTSTYTSETSFAILIAILGLVLFAHLIGNMQLRHRRGKSETTRAQYINTKDVRLTISTWNVAGRVPDENLDIDDWISSKEPSNIYIFG